MKHKTWLLVGATSKIAEEFGHLAALNNYHLILAGRDCAQLTNLAANFRLQYAINCDILIVDFSNNFSDFLEKINRIPAELSLFIAHSSIRENGQLTLQVIQNLVQVNILSISQLIHVYWHRKQARHQLIFLSSVAACRGRIKNSLYGGSKAAIEVYLQGLQQAATPNQTITIAKLGFIDTVQTFGIKGVFYASPPKACAKACWRAVQKGQRQFYHPFFWRYIMIIITSLPFFIYKRIKEK